MERMATAAEPSMRSDNASGLQLSTGTDMANSAAAPATSVSSNEAHSWHPESNGVKAQSSAHCGPVTVPPPKSTAAQRAAVAEGPCPVIGVDDSAPGPVLATSGVLAPAHPKRTHQTIPPPNRNATDITSQKAVQPPPPSVPPPPPGPLPTGFHAGMVASVMQVPAGVPPPPPPFPPPQLPDMQANAFVALQRQMGMAGFPQPPGLNELQAVTMASMGGHVFAGGLPPDVLGMASLMGLPNVVPQHFPLGSMLHPGLIPGGICAGASASGNVDPSSILGKPSLQGLVAGADGLLHPVGVNGSASLLGLNSPLHMMGQPGFMPGFNGVMMHHPALLQSMPGSVMAHSSAQQLATAVAGGSQTESAKKEMAGTAEGNEEEEEGELEGDSDEDDEPLMSCIRRWAWKDDALSGTAETCSSGGARNSHRRRLASIRWAINSLLEEVADQAAFEMAKEVFIKARPDAAKSWDSLAARLAMTPSQAELEALHSKDGVGPAKIVELSQVPGGQVCEGDDDMEVDDVEVSSAAATQTLGLVDANPVGLASGTMGAAFPGDQQKLRDASKQKEPQQNAAKSPDTTFPAGKAQLSKEPGPAEFEEIVNSLPVQPYWKIPSQSAEVPVGVRLRVFDFDGAKEVASMAVTKPLVFGGDAERAHVVERRGLGVYAEHVGLVYTPKGFHVYPISGQSVVSAVVHHRALLIKLRSETAKLPDDRAEHCNGLLDQMEKQAVSSTLFQPGDGRRKLTWQACCFSLGRSERIYFLDLVTRADLLHASGATQHTGRATEAVEATAAGNPDNSSHTLALADGKADGASPQKPLARSRSKSALPKQPAETKQPSIPESTAAQAESKSDAKTAHAKAASTSPKRTLARSPARASRQDRRNISRKRSSSRNRRDQDRGRAKSNSRRRDRDRDRRRSKSRRRSRSRGRRSCNNRRSRSRRRHRSRSASRVYRRRHRSLDRRRSVSRDRHQKSRSPSRGKDKDKTKDKDKDKDRDKKKRPKKAKKEKVASPKVLRKETASPSRSPSPSSSDLVAPLKKQVVVNEIKEDVKIEKRARNVLDGDRDIKLRQLAGDTKQAASDPHVPEHESIDKAALDQVADTKVTSDEVEVARKFREEQEQKLREQKLRDEILRKARERREREEKEKRELEEKEKKEKETLEKQEQDEKRRKEEAALKPVDNKSVGRSSSGDSSTEVVKKKKCKAKAKKGKDKKTKGRDSKKKKDSEKRRKRKKRRETSSSSERSSSSS